MAAHNNCPKYADSTQCAGYQDNKTCSHCDHNSAGFIPAPTERAPLEKNDKIRAAMDKILSIFQGNNLEIVTRAVFTAPAGFERPCDKWSFMNRIFTMCAGTDDARGYKQWQQVGRNVKKGSHAFTIFGPLIKKIEDKVTHEDKVLLYGFKSIPVFRYEDTEGADIPQAPKVEVQIPYNFNSIIAELKLTVQTSFFNGSCYGYYAPSRQLISLSSPDLAVFLHELSHAVDTHLGAVKKQAGQQTDREVVAEFSAAVVGAMMGYNVAYGTHKQYIEAYSFKELMQQLARCEKVIKFIMDRTTAMAPTIPAPTSISQTAIAEAMI